MKKVRGEKVGAKKQTPVNQIIVDIACAQKRFEEQHARIRREHPSPRAQILALATSGVHGLRMV